MLCFVFIVYFSRFLFIITLMTPLGKPSARSNLRLAVLLLAAGEGSRLGSIPKALLSLEGHSLLQRLCQTVQVLSPVEFLVLTGFHALAIEAEILQVKQELDLSIGWVRNPNPELGQPSSVRLGLECLKSDYDVLVLALCDQPAIGTGEIIALLEQFEKRTGQEEIILPMFDQQRGNPVLFSKKVIKEILAIPAMVCRPFMDQHPELVHVFETDNKAYVQDVDTPEDIQKLGLKQL
jgi:molybdenum cofactor cytidylyltransferase/nicotine blue oxidoreductase